MIPVNLKLSNFTSYGENPPELDFTQFKLAAISGLNGAGKSSLLDSITWCLWGTSRAGDSSDDLVRLGQSEMFTEFSFELDGHIYTVKRRRSKKGGGSTALEFWSNSHNLTEGTIKATQEKITNTLHLNFETFSNSSYLRQGHADEFTTKGPTDRKRILADILGLDHYDRLEVKAKEKSKEAQTKLQLMDYQILEIEAELSQKEDREKSLTLAETEAREVEKQLKELELLIKVVDERYQKVNIQVKSLQEKKNQLLDTQAELADLKLQMELKQKAKEEFQAILDKKEAIEKGYQKLQDLISQKNVLDEKRSELIKIKDELVEIQKVIKDREEKRTAAINKVEIEVKEFQTRNESLQKQIDHLKNKKDLCPTCGQAIDEEKKNTILDENLKQIAQNEIELKKLGIVIGKYQSIILPEYSQAAQKEEAIKRLEEETKSYFEISEQIQKLEKVTNFYTKLQQAEIGVKTHQEALLDLQKMYKSKAEQISKSEQELKNLEKAEQDLLEVKSQLEAKEQEKHELSQKALEIRGRIGEAKQLVSRTTQLEELFTKKREEKTKLQKEKDIFEELALAFGKKGIQAMIIEQAIPEIEDEANKLLASLTEGRMQITLETQKETKAKIKNIDGTKTYATVETLDIVISDEMGERNYENFSGGEQFRVNFAIRLAISKLLTHRAGAKLQFLVIDEGFGTQDAPGRARLVEVLDAIKNDFEKIIVITHIEELKEEFPIRIEVSKNSQGSTFEVVGI
ncbi:SMC family ATPase [Candidatus Daviesbacteria bacterium]|nr:SMC family ATPase [Candidatus Daviesbacteria bacterium]